MAVVAVKELNIDVKSSEADYARDNDTTAKKEIIANNKEQVVFNVTKKNGAKYVLTYTHHVGELVNVTKLVDSVKAVVLPSEAANIYRLQNVENYANNLYILHPTSKEFIKVTLNKATINRIYIAYSYINKFDDEDIQQITFDYTGIRTEGFAWKPTLWVLTDDEYQQHITRKAEAIAANKLRSALLDFFKNPELDFAVLQQAAKDLNLSIDG